jgi:enoyl-CoA hydratase/carnithine racemase
VVPTGQELIEALRIAEQIARQAPLAVVATRLNALKAVEQGPLVAMAEFDAVQQRLANSEDAKEGVASFREKRASVFNGR